MNYLTNLYENTDKNVITILFPVFLDEDPDAEW